MKGGLPHGAIALAPVPLLLALPLPAFGQSLTARDIGSTASAITANDKEYRVRPNRIGPFDATIGGEARIEYDSNIYAEPDNPKNDVRLQIMPELKLSTSPAPVTLVSTASAVIRRYADAHTENAEGWLVDSTVNWKPDQASSLAVRGYWQRSIEDRGDPEARQDDTIGPRLVESLGATMAFRRVTGRLLLDFQGEAIKHNAIAKIDADRDFMSYAGQLTAGMRMSGTLFLTAGGFAVRRDFRIDRTIDGVKRNTTTFGGRVGIDVEPGGLIDGNFSVGVFRFNPDDPGTKGHTGLSVSGNLTWTPRRRTAVVLSAFNGDVATFRTGARQRTDTTVKLTVQQEIRHNLYANVSGGYRKTKYTFSDIKEDTLTATGELEYMFSRNMSVAATANYGNRDSDDYSQKFSRFQGGVSLRLRF